MDTRKESGLEVNLWHVEHALLLSSIKFFVSDVASSGLAARITWNGCDKIVDVAF
jgi:hypothetical protein